MRLSSRDMGCEGHGQCEMVDGDLFPLDDEGYTKVPVEGIDVPAGKEETAKAGVDVCPVQALLLS